MDIIVERFFKKNNIDVKKVRELPECRMYNIGEKNAIAQKYGIFSLKKVCEVSVGDIIGYDWQFGEKNNNLVDDMSNFFSERGDGYHTRANGMLDYTSDNILEGLERSFDEEPVVLNEVDNNYFIGRNGLHRFHILRLHYLNELSMATSDEEKQKIREKYKIKVQSGSLDYIKTYCNFLLSMISNSYWVSNAYDQNYNITGKVRLDNGNEKMIMTDEELINFVKLKFEEKEFSDFEHDNLNLRLQHYQETIPSFNSFMNEYFNTLHIGRIK